MNKRRVFLWLTAASGYTGLGMLLGYSFGDKTSNTPLWLGGILVLLGALLLGMYVSARPETSETTIASRNADSDRTEQ